MKKTFAILSCIIFLTACKKENFKSFKQQFSGTWEMRSFYGYPFNFLSLPAGNGRIIVMGTDGSFERRSYDTVSFKGTYSLDERKDCYGDAKQIFISTTDNYFTGGIITVVGDTLTISSSNCLADGGTSVYKRN